MVVNSLISKKYSIGIFDSGMGGLSVLGDTMRMMPTENFIYYGDSLNAPYGVKSKEELTDLSMHICDFLMENEVKAIVVACNTATSAAINDLRQKFDIPIIGMEPALKPAVCSKNSGSIAVLATEVTLREEKFNNLMMTYANDRDIIKIPCPNLVELVESGTVSGEKALEEVKKCFEGIDITKLSAIVLGCTHFIFLKSVFKDFLGDDIEVFDGNLGTARYLQSKLESMSMLNLSNESPTIKIYNSKDEKYLIQSKDLLDKYKTIY